jgi:thiol-disulfide isomerase/thioredoxin
LHKAITLRLGGDPRRRDRIVVISLVRRLAVRSADSPARFPNLGAAPELRGVHPWLNTPGGEPLTLAGLRGRVVLIEFWTFACGNCQRTVPFLRRLHNRYGTELVAVGIHTPEFPFERPVRNVERAVRDRAIAFPVGLDNDYQAWSAYGNRYWPSQYLVDPAGRIRYTHVGEGGYGGIESAIRTLLGHARQANGRPGDAAIGAVETNPDAERS